MTVFAYTAIDPNGRTAEGSIEAATKSGALASLTEGGLTVVDLAEETTKEHVPWYRRELTLFSSAGDRDLAMLSNGLAMMLKQQLPLARTVDVLIKSTSSRNLVAGLKQVLIGLQSGEAPDTAFKRAATVFPTDFIAIVRSGVSTNTLADAFEAAARHYESNHKRKKQVIGAIAYPAFLLFAAVLVLLIILQTMVPALYETLTSAGTTPSGTLNALDAASRALYSWWQLLVLGLFSLSILATVFWQRILGLISFAVPGLHRLIVERSYARLARQLSMFLKSGERLDQAMSTILAGARNETHHDVTAEARSALLAGASATRVFQSAPDVPEVFRELYEIGDATNNLPEMLNLAAETLEANAEQRVSRLTGLLTPVLTLFVGAVIALLVQVLLTAVLEISQVAI